MPRQVRIDAPGALHHVMTRGIDRRSIFADHDRDHFLGRIAAENQSVFAELLNIDSGRTETSIQAKSEYRISKSETNSTIKIQNDEP